VKINFGCGRQLLPGFLNIDAVDGPLAPRPDLAYTARFDAAGQLLAPVPLPAGCAEQLQAMHVIEHVYAWEAPALVAECPT
jgi:hypothetical protein